MSGRALFFLLELPSLKTARIGQCASSFFQPQSQKSLARRIFFLCSVPARMVCGGVMAWRAHLPLPPVWIQNLPVPQGDASPPTGCVTTRMTVAMVRTRCVRPHALRISSAAPARRGESQASGCRCCSDSSIVSQKLSGIMHKKDS